VKASYRVALACGAAPLVAGISVFLLWLATHAAWLMAAGTIVIFVGLACFGVGLLALGRFCWLALAAPEPPRRFWAATALCAALLVSNFPAAGLILVKVIEIVTYYTVVVHNESGGELEGVRIVGRGRVYAALGTLPPGGTATRSFAIAHEGPLDVEAGGTTHTIDSYVTSSGGRLAIATFRPDGSVSVEFGTRH
jgi:hypothetical protein